MGFRALGLWDAGFWDLGTLKPSNLGREGFRGLRAPALGLSP